MDRFRQFNLKIEPDKCEFLKKELSYLGHVVTSKGVRLKVKAIEKFSTPRNEKDLVSTGNLSLNLIRLPSH